MFITRTLQEKGYPPTILEIAHQFRLASPYGVQRHLLALERKGYLKRVPGRARGLELVGPKGRLSPPATVEVPILGRIAAGQPLLAVEQWERTLALDRRLVGRGEAFLVKVRGDSMIEAGIFDGDYVLVRTQPTAESGEIVAVLFDDEATVKRLVQRREGLFLQPEHPRMVPIKVTKEDRVRILGKVIGVIRLLHGVLPRVGSPR